MVKIDTPTRETLEKVARMHGIHPYPFLNDDQLSEHISKVSGVSIDQTLRSLNGWSDGVKLPSAYLQISRIVTALANLQGGLITWEQSGHQIGAHGLLEQLADMAEQAEALDDAEFFTVPKV